MTGHKLFNFPAFDAKRDELRALGHFPISPADLDRAVGFDPSDPAAVATIPIDERFIDGAIMRDVLAILGADALLLLKGWEHSRGARGELGVAQWKGLKVFFPGEMVPMAQQEADAA
jgi:hypothetical protein